jgi:hypothetical protein
MHPPLSGGGAVPQARLVGEKLMLMVLDPASVAVPEKLTLPLNAGNEPVTVSSNVSDFPGLNGMEPVIGEPPENGEGSIVKSI